MSDVIYTVEHGEYDRKNGYHPSIYANPINEVDGKATAVEWEPTNG